MPKAKPKTCFVIMPFGEKAAPDGSKINFDDVYEYLIYPVATELGLNATRADKMPTPGWVHADMIRMILDADVAIVDISLLNANVLYELGVRHALKSSVTVIIRQKGTTIPFNLTGMRVLEYGLSLKEAATAKEELKKFLENGLASTSTDSLVYSVLPNLKVQP